MVFKIKVWFVEMDDVYRTFELKPTDSFLSFQQAINQSIQFSLDAKVEFFVVDDLWRKKSHIGNQKNDLTIGDLKLSFGQAITQPYQKFIYIADIEQDWVLHCEMIGINKDAQPKISPYLIKSEGNPPKQNPLAATITNEKSNLDDFAASILLKSKAALLAKDEPSLDDLNDLDLDDYTSDFDVSEEDEIQENETNSEEDSDNENTMFDEEFGTDEGDLDGFSEEQM